MDNGYLEDIVSLHWVRPVFDEKVVLVGSEIIMHEYRTPIDRVKSTQEKPLNCDFVTVVVNSVIKNRIMKEAHYFSQLCPV